MVFGERLVFFCFRSCLKGEDTTELYDVLEITNISSANIDTIKRQYKSLSLSYHPVHIYCLSLNLFNSFNFVFKNSWYIQDKLKQRGIEVTPEHKQKFLKLKEAYDVLSDPKRKQMYDEFGSTGLTFMEHPSELNPKEFLRNFQVKHHCLDSYLLCT